MPDLFEHELASYLREIDALDRDEENLSEVMERGENLTHFALGLSNRGNLMILGMCSLVEVRLSSLAEEKEAQSPFKLSDIRGSGLGALKVFLDRTSAIDFRRLKYWVDFQHLYVVRNVLVHSYGGVVRPRDVAKLEGALTVLKLKHVYSTQRIRCGVPALRQAHDIISSLIKEINESISKSGTAADG